MLFLPALSQGYNIYDCADRLQHQDRHRKQVRFAHRLHPLSEVWNKPPLVGRPPYAGIMHGGGIRLSFSYHIGELTDMVV
jgi:hypothetical protein